MNVILRPLNQDSHILRILSIFSKVTEPVITKLHIELHSFIICSNDTGHMPNMIKNLSNFHFKNQLTDGLDTLYVGSSTQVQ